jgi:hypothetical protein
MAYLSSRLPCRPCAGKFAVIRSLLRALEGGYTAKGVLDKVIDACSAMQVSMQQQGRAAPKLLEAPFTPKDKASSFQWASQMVNMPQEAPSGGHTETWLPCPLV